MKGLLFQASNEGIEESYLENEKDAHIIVSCDVCSPFSEHLKESVLESTRALVRETLAIADEITEGDLRKTFHKVNEQLRTQYKKDKKRIALSLTIITKDTHNDDVMIASSGDMHVCTSTESGLNRLYPEKESNPYISERERLKELHQALIRNPAPFVQVTRHSLSQSEHMGVIPQALYHHAETHELNEAISKPHDPEFGIESLIEKSELKDQNFQVSILLDCEASEITESMHSHSSLKEDSPRLPQGLYSETVKKKSPQKTLALSLAICALMVATGFTLYELSSKSDAKVKIANATLNNSVMQDSEVKDLKNENTLQSERIHLLAEEINSIKQDIESDIAEDQEEISDLKEAIEEKDLAITEMQEDLNNQVPATLEHAQIARAELARQLDETTSRSNEQKQILNKLEKSLSEEVQKSQFLRDSLATEISKREDQEQSLVNLAEENQQLQILYDKERSSRKALHTFNMQKHLETNPYLKPSESLAPIPSKKLIQWGQEKKDLQAKIASLSESHDELVVENQVLYQTISDMENPQKTRSDQSKEVSPESLIAMEELQERNRALSTELASTQKSLEAKLSPAQQNLSYLDATNKALQGELQRIKKSNVSLSRELHSLKRAFGSLEQESIALERISTPQNMQTSSSSYNTSQVHTVKRGETLSEISLLYYGTSKKWRSILEANKDKIHSSNMIQVGMELTIP